MEDIQGEGGGGSLADITYDNPTLTESSQTISNRKTCRGFDNFEVINEPHSSTPFQYLKNIATWSKEKTKKICTKRTLYKRLPILTWLPKYATEDAVGDFVAGITVGLTVIPQSLAYANIAHLPLEYGLYSSFLGCLIYIFIGTCKDVPFGPSAIASLMTYEAIHDKGPQHAIVLCFLSGVIQFLMGIFGFGFMIDFVSGPVASGFTSAVALIILTSQVKDFLGIPTSGTVFIHTWSSIFKNIHKTNIWDALLGLICIVCILTLRIGSGISISDVDKLGNKRTRFQIWRNRIFWFIATSRNAIVVIVCGYVGYSFFQHGRVPFTLIGHVPQGLPSVQVPPFSHSKQVGNSTINVSFTEIVSDLGSNIIVVPLIALLEDIAICKVFSNGKTVDSMQEFLALGVCNMANSFVQAFPGTGSVSRSAVQHSSGSRTPMCGLYTGIIVIFALLFFTPCFFFIPKPTLAAVLIAAVIFMVEYRVIRPMWRSKKSDLLLCIGTFVACLVFPLEIGVSIGVGVNLIFILHQAARPKISIERLKTRNGTKYLMVTPDRCLIFPSVDYVKNLVTKHSKKENIPVVLDCSYIYGADYTAACVIEVLTEDFASRKQTLVFFNLKPSVSAVFEGLSIKDFRVVYDEQGLQQLLENRPVIMTET
ncbi:hypothetical protein WA026_000043 [Henosepilachna vigintioctopunctata]